MVLPGAIAALVASSQLLNEDSILQVRDDVVDADGLGLMDSMLVHVLIVGVSVARHAGGDE